MTVRQFEGGHVAFLSRPGEELTILEPLDWVSVRYDADDDFEIGRDWEKDPPEQAASLRREQRIGEA